LCAANSASALIALDVDEAWYFAGSGVPVGWKERAVGFKEVPLLAAVVSVWIAPGAMVVVDALQIVGELCGETLVRNCLLE
jgi:hypothetical protein